MRTTAGVIAIMVLGCGDNLGAAFDAPMQADGPPTADAPMTADGAPDATVADAAPDAGTPDAGTPDAAPVDAGPDASPPGAGLYVMSTALIPTNSAEVQSYGMDIDSDQPGGDIGIDNQLGAVLAALASMAFDIQGATTTSIDRGLSIDLSWYDTATGEFHTYVGTNPDPPACTGPGDTVCRHHLDGTATFDVATGAPTGVMPTVTVGSTTTGGPGTAVLQLGFFGTGPTTVPLIGARLTGTIDANGITNAKLAGAVPESVIDNEIVPGIAANLAAVIAVDCPAPTPPSCNCTPGSTGETVLATFDANNDCVLTAAELANDPLIQALLMPDVNIGGVDALSIGFRFTAVTGTFTPP